MSALTVLGVVVGWIVLSFALAYLVAAVIAFGQRDQEPWR